MNEEGYRLHPLSICNRLLNFIRKKLPTFSLKPIALGCFDLLICHRLINSIVQIFASQAIKPVTLGRPMTGASMPSGGSFSYPGDEFRDTKAVWEPSQVQENIDAEKRIQEKVGIQARAPTKAITANDNAEEIIRRKKRKRKKTAIDKFVI